MNNTKTLAIAAILIAAILVVGTFAATATTQTALAYQKKRGGSQENSKDGNTITLQKCKQAATESGFDNTEEQECQNLICTHPGNNATCSEEGVGVVTPTTTTATTIQVSGQGEGQNFCPQATESLPASITFSAHSDGGTVQGEFTIVATFGGGQLTKTGTLNGLQISGGSFTATGTELSQPGLSRCSLSQLPSSATISGQCGTGVTIQFATADGEHATFIGNVACT
jgi:hypothetical protein